MRTLLAFGGGLLDAIPGILLMTASSLGVPGFPWLRRSHRLAGPAARHPPRRWCLLAVAESVGLPVIGAVFAE